MDDAWNRNLKGSCDTFGDFGGCLLIGLVGSLFERERVDCMKERRILHYRSPFLFDSRVGKILAKTFNPVLANTSFELASVI